MDYYASSIKQLDMAIDQLLVGDDPAYARFALMLTDNIVELMLHGQCEMEIVLGRWQRKYDEKTCRAVLGRNFDEKNKFCLHLGRLSQDEFDTIRICHSYRNELYHAGLKYDAIVPALAWMNHAVACDLLERLPRMMYAYPNDELAPAVKRHVGDLNGLFDFEEMKSRAARSLAERRPAPKTKIQTTLAEYMTKEIARVVGDLDFIVEHTPLSTVSEAISELEFEAFARLEIDKRRANFPADNELAFAAYQEERRRLRANWRPKYASCPAPSWEARVPKIASSTTAIGALRRFENLRRDMSYLSGLAREAAYEVDAEVQRRIDELRGK